MIHLLRDYFRDLSRAGGAAWERFWFSASDPLPVAVLRIVAAVAALYYHLTYAFSLADWFGPRGLLDVGTTLRVLGESANYRVTPLWHTADPNVLLIWWVFGLLAILAYAGGWLSRISGALTLLVVLSWVHRKPMLVDPVEPVLTMLLCYLLLAPTGAYLSVDRWLADRRAEGSPPAAPPSWLANLSLRLVQTHLALFYLMFGLTKLGGFVWWNGEAVWWILAQPRSPLVDLRWLQEQVLVVNVWTHGIVLFEISAGVLLWVPKLRPLVWLLSIVSWTSIGLIAGLPDFALLMIATTGAAFLPLDMLRALCPTSCVRSSKVSLSAA